MHKDGIYFNMSENEYFSDAERLDFSGMKKILESPVKYWFNSRLNPLYEEKTSPAMLAGKMWHSYILEPENFYKKCCVMPDEIDNLSKNSKDYKKWRDLQTKEVLTPSEFNEMYFIIQYLKTKGQIFDDNIFTGGFPEVSIFFTYQDVKCKARIDYLRLKQLVDLKTVASVGDFDDYCRLFFIKYKVYMQLYFYREAINAAKSFDNSQVFGDKKQVEFWHELKQQEDISPYVCYVSRIVPEASLRAFMPGACPDLYRLAAGEVKKTLDVYKFYCREYGLNRAWLGKKDYLSVLKDEDFPQLFFKILEVSDYER